MSQQVQLIQIDYASKTSNIEHRHVEKHSNIFQLFGKNDRRNPLYTEAGGSESTQVTG